MWHLSLQLYLSFLLSVKSQGAPSHLCIIARHYDARKRMRRVGDLALGKCERVVEGHTGRLESVSEFTFAPVYHSLTS